MIRDYLCYFSADSGTSHSATSAHSTVCGRVPDGTSYPSSPPNMKYRVTAQ